MILPIGEHWAASGHDWHLLGRDAATCPKRRAQPLNKEGHGVQAEKKARVADGNGGSLLHTLKTGKKERQAGRKGEFVLCLQSTDFQCGCSKCGLLFFKFLELRLCIYFERERERESGSRGRAERGREHPKRALRTVGAKPGAGA